MSEYAILAIFAAFVFVYISVSNRLSKTMISGAIVFTAFGVLCGPHVFNILPLDIEAESLKTLAEWTLALVLFSDAACADLGVIRKSIGLPQRLLLIGLPLTIALGFGAGWLIFDGLGMLELAILATMLAPTDAALGKAVVSNEAVPAKVRESLNVESGLNDGICVPVLFIFLALITGENAEGGTASLALRLLLEEIGIGAAVGLGVTFVASKFLKWCMGRDWIAETWLPLPVLALAFICFATAQAFGGSGFIASFVGGLLFGKLAKEQKEHLLHAAEGTGGIFSILTWIVFGVAVVGTVFEKFTWNCVLYAVLSLTVIRMLPVVLSLIGSGLRLDSKLFIGWFGPRGLASVVFIIIVIGEHLPGQKTLAMTVACTVILSIIAHGVTAVPLASAYGARAQKSGV
ncbi:MAG: cation:proton antiporter [Planctomycetota bacterium]|jgi:NhaP-type Na+/H+ or K+/H+ antiporter